MHACNSSLQLATHQTVYCNGTAITGSLPKQQFCNRYTIEHFWEQSPPERKWAYCQFPLPSRQLSDLSWHPHVYTLFANRIDARKGAIQTEIASADSSLRTMQITTTGKQTVWSSWINDSHDHSVQTVWDVALTVTQALCQSTLVSGTVQSSQLDHDPTCWNNIEDELN